MPNVLHTQFAIGFWKGAVQIVSSLHWRTHIVSPLHNHSRDMANFIYVIEQSAFIVQPTMVGKI
ncbi:hypothetical protein [Kingella kingae]|uniref:hypothetical protein n=1 Tax=Kingella kingae TaxID=504 RepID=UPI0012BC6A26